MAITAQRPSAYFPREQERNFGGISIAPSTLKNHLSQNTHFFEENCQKQGCFVTQCQKLSWGVKFVSEIFEISSQVFQTPS
jgi:hypothetical protein